MTIASAALAAAPSMPVASARSVSGSGADFAQQLRGTVTPDGPVNAAATCAQSVDTAELPVMGQSPISHLLNSALPPPTAAGKPASSAKQPNRKSDPPPQPAIPVAVAAPVAPPTPEAIATPEQSTPQADAAIAFEIAATLAPPISAPKPSKPEAAQPGDAPAVTAASGVAPRAEDLAFAVRVQPVQSTAHTALNHEMASASAVASASKKPAGDEQPAQHFDATPLAQPVTHSITEPSMTPATAHSAPAAAPETVHHAATAMPASETVAKPTAPIKDISLQLSQPGKERVDVRVVQQGNEVRVSVHSGDTALSSGLRQGLSELQGKLEETGYRSEVWRPNAAAAPVAQATGSQSTNNQSRGEDAPAGQHQGGSQQESGRRHQNPSNQPHWQEELESSTASGSTFTGGTLGFRS